MYEITDYMFLRLVSDETRRLWKELRKVSTAKLACKHWSLFLPSPDDQSNQVALVVTVRLQDGCEKSCNIAI